MNISESFLTWSLIFLGVGSPLLRPSDEATNVKIVSERVERVSRDKVHFWLKVVNTPSSPIFLIGLNYEKPRPYPLFLEQWQGEKGWKAVAPCPDVPPPDVIRLNPSEAMTLDFVLTLPVPTICNERNFQLAGKFRYRLDYFESEKEARAYVKLMYSPDWQRARSPAAVSEPFEIPPPKK
jgi:hypothetical protein